MPFLGPVILPAFQDANPPQVRQVKDIDGGVLRIEYHEVQGNFTTRTHLYSGGIRVEYGPTTILCDSLELDELNRHGRAMGKVQILDPEGTATCENLDFYWLAKGMPDDPQKVLAEARNVNLTVGNVRIWGERLQIKKENWLIENARGTLSRRNKPEWTINAKRVSLIPGRRGVAEQVVLDASGLRIGPIPRYSFTLDKRLKGQGLPSITYDREKGPGFSWGTGIAVGKDGVFQASWAAFPNTLPTFSLEYTISGLDPKKATAIASPRSELSDRFSDSWFENIAVKTPEQEAGELRTARKSLSIASRWNIVPTNRSDTLPAHVSKPLEIVVEKGGQVGSYGTRFQGRIQTIRSQTGDPYIGRLSGSATVQSPGYKLAENLEFVLRGDSYTTLSSNGGYSWLTANAGIAYKPNKNFTFGASYSSGAEFGNADFDFDRLIAKQSVNLRFDLKSGPYTLRYLTKFDPKMNKIYDREYEVAWQWGSFEPFILYRQNPSEYRIGFRFLLGSFADHLTERNIKRKTK